MLVWEQQPDDQSEAALCTESDGRLMLFKSQLSQLKGVPMYVTENDLNETLVRTEDLVPFVVGTRFPSESAFMMIDPDQKLLLPELLVHVRWRRLQTDLYQNMAWLARPVVGFIYPIVILFTILTNAIFLVVLLERRMRNAYVPFICPHPLRT